MYIFVFSLFATTTRLLTANLLWFWRSCFITKWVPLFKSLSDKKTLNETSPIAIHSLFQLLLFALFSFLLFLTTPNIHFSIKNWYTPTLNYSDSDTVQWAWLIFLTPFIILGLSYQSVPKTTSTFSLGWKGGETAPKVIDLLQRASLNLQWCEKQQIISRRFSCFQMFVSLSLLLYCACCYACYIIQLMHFVSL